MRQQGRFFWLCFDLCNFGFAGGVKACPPRSPQFLQNGRSPVLLAELPVRKTRPSRVPSAEREGRAGSVGIPDDRLPQRLVVATLPWLPQSGYKPLRAV